MRAYLRCKSAKRYIDTARSAILKGGNVIIVTFTADVAFHLSSPENLHDQFGEGSKIVDIAHETHRTRFGTQQKFMYQYCCKD